MSLEGARLCGAYFIDLVDHDFGIDRGWPSPALRSRAGRPPPDPNATAQQSPAEPAQNAGRSADALDRGTSTDDNAIVVTGLADRSSRRGTSSATATRSSTRSSPRISASCPTSPCPTPPRAFRASRSSANGGEASRVLLRGLDRTYYTTTYNGREIFTAETRSVALQDFPAGRDRRGRGVQDLDREPGRARPRRTDQRPLAPPVRLQGLRDRRLGLGRSPATSRATSSRNGNILITDRWRVGDGEFGALINFSYTRLHYQDSIRRHGFFIADLAGLRSPDWPEIRL